MNGRTEALMAGGRVLAPDDRRGAYLGAFGATLSAGFAIGPLVALQLRGAAGDDAMWMFFGTTAVVAAPAGAAALGDRRSAAKAPLELPS